MPPLSQIVETLSHRGEPVMQRESRSDQGGTPIGSQGAPDRTAVAAEPLGFRVCPAGQLSFDGADPTDTRFQRFFGMAVRRIDGLGGLTEIVDMTQLRGHRREGRGHGTPDRQWASRDDADDGDAQGRAHRLQQDRPVVLGGRQHATRHEHLCGDAIPDDPQHLVAHGRLQAVEGQYHAPLGWRDPLEARRVGAREGDEFVVPFSEVQHGPQGNGNTAALQVMRDLGHTPVLGVTQCSDQGDDIQAKRVCGEGEPPLLFRPGGRGKLGTRRIGTPSYLECEAQHGGQRGDRPGVVLGGPHRLPTAHTIAGQGAQHQGRRRLRARGCSWQREYLQRGFSLSYRYRPTET